LKTKPNRRGKVCSTTRRRPAVMPSAAHRQAADPGLGRRAARAPLVAKAQAGRPRAFDAEPGIARRHPAAKAAVRGRTADDEGVHASGLPRGDTRASPTGERQASCRAPAGIIGLPGCRATAARLATASAELRPSSWKPCQPRRAEPQSVRAWIVARRAWASIAAWSKIGWSYSNRRSPCGSGLDVRVERHHHRALHRQRLQAVDQVGTR
jgi:hypothetical protein